MNQKFEAVAWRLQAALLAMFFAIPVVSIAGTMSALPGVPGADEIAWDINDDGVVVGATYQVGMVTPVRWIDATIELLDGPLLVDGDSCVLFFGDARHVTDDGTIVGRVAGNCGGTLVLRVATWDTDLEAWAPLPVPAGAPFTVSSAANGDGDVAYRAGSGNVLYDAETGAIAPIPDSIGCIIFALNKNGIATGRCGQTAVAWIDGVRIPLDGKNGDNNYGRGLNDHGTIVGVISNDRSQGDLFHSPARAVVWDSWQPDQPKVLRTGWATDINNGGVIVGTTGYNSQLPDAPANEAAMWSGNRLQTLGTLGGPESIARAINENGVVVGESDTETLVGTIEIDGVIIEIYERDAFIWVP